MRIVVIWLSVISIGLAPVGSAFAQAQPMGATELQAKVQQSEITFWRSVERRGSIADFQADLDAYPNGHFSVLTKSANASVPDEDQNPSLRKAARGGSGEVREEKRLA